MKKYRSKVDWWLYLIMVAMIAVTIFMMIDAPSIGTAILSVFLIAMMPYYILTTWYAIDGNTLIIHWMFVTERLPIDKISEVNYVMDSLLAQLHQQRGCRSNSTIEKS